MPEKVTNARRLPVINGKPQIPELPGDYCGPFYGYTGDKWCVQFLKPNARDEDAPAVARAVQHVTSPPHVFRECQDGSLEIRESISDKRHGSNVSDGWHGYLDEGNIWRQV